MKWHPFLSATSSRKNSKPVLFGPMAEHNYKNCKSKKNKNRKNNFRTKSILPSLPYHPLWLISSFRRCSKRSCRKNYCTYNGSLIRECLSHCSGKSRYNRRSCKNRRSNCPMFLHPDIPKNYNPDLTRHNNLTSARSCCSTSCNIELAGRNPDKNTNRKSFRRKFLQLCNNFPSKNRRFCSIFLSRRMKDTRNWKMVRTRKNR